MSCDLPAAIQHLICGVVGHHSLKLDEGLTYSQVADTSRERLGSLALVNRSWYHAAVPFIYRNLHLHISRPEKLLADIEAILDNPFRNNYLIYVRALELTGWVLSVKENGGGYLPNIDHPIFGRGYNEELYLPEYDRSILKSGEVQRERELELLPIWVPLASLISRFQHLTDLSYACLSQFPSRC